MLHSVRSLYRVSSVLGRVAPVASSFVIAPQGNLHWGQSDVLVQTQVRYARLNPGRYQMRKGLSTSSIDAVVEPTPPSALRIRSVFDIKRYFLNVYWNARSWWESLDPRLSLKGMKKEAETLFVHYHEAEASGDFSSLYTEANMTFVQELKKKITNQGRKNLSIEWKHTTPKTKIRTIRYIRYPNSPLKVLQVGVQFDGKQGLVIKKKGKLLKEVPMKHVSELLVMEASMNVTKKEAHKWKLLDVLDNEGYGLLPSGKTQTYLEEQ